MAKALILSAKQNGATTAKFQLFNAEDDKGKPHYAWVKAHELTFDQAKLLFSYGASIGMEVFFSVFGPEYVAWCESIGVKRYKLARPGWPRYKETLAAISRTQKPMIMSGTHSRVGLWQQEQGISFRGIYLWCPESFSHFSEVNFNDGSCQGYSDHTPGLDAAKITLARGAEIIEKHFILNRFIPAPDLAWSMLPDGLKELARWEKVCAQLR